MFQSVLVAVVLLLQVTRLLANDVRVSCPTDAPGIQCSLDCKHLGVCDGSNNWYWTKTCGDDEICFEGSCQTLTNGMECSTSNSNIKVSCYDSNLNVPDIYSGDCSSYYSCGTGDDNDEGEIHVCLTGSFDPCTGSCSSTVGCGNTGTYVECNSNAELQVLVKNPKLAYICVQNSVTREYEIIWITCPKGIWISGACDETILSTCANGNNEDEDGGDDGGDDGGEDGTCSNGVGKWPTPGTNCYYRVCYANGSYRDLKCAEGYHYEQASKTCVSGGCDPN